MSKKNSSVILKKKINNKEKFSFIYLNLKKKLNSLKTKSFLVAVSGGPDSLALTALTKLYSSEHNRKFYYVLVDHNLRKKSSEEAISVKKLLKKNKISLHILKNKIKINSNIQSKARTIRYNLLCNYCRKKNIKTILTAHNLEDQVETFFIRLSRGSGLHGLSSMRENSKIQGNVNLLRPLLGTKKASLVDLSKNIFGKYYKDPSNKNQKFLRTRIRSLKKHLEKTGINYNQIFNSIKNLSSSRDSLDQYINKIYKDIVKTKKNKILIDIKGLNSLNSEMKMRIFKKSILNISKSYYSPRSKKILNLIYNIKSSKKAVKFTLGGCLILKDKNQVILTKENKK